MNDDRTMDFTSDDRDPFDRIAEEFAARSRRGESPSIAEYEARHPDQAEKVRGLLGAVAMMEQLRRGSAQARFLPERLGEFRVIRELGRGGVGVVYEAVQESLGRHVAVKAIHHVQLDPRRLQRFQREAQAVAQLHHTNIVPIFGVGEHDGLPYYVMQYIKGDGLDVHLERWRRDPTGRPEDRWRFASRMGVQAAGALHHAHEQGVLHRDIKPSNLLIDEHETLWITDFGLAKLAGLDDLTASGDVIGTLRYLAPEALRGESGRRGDVYSLGLTLYEMITLNSPFGELGPSELLRRVGDGDLPAPRRLVPNIPPDLETILLKSIARDPADRYPTAAALADDLRSFLEDRPIQARRATPIERTWRWARRNRAIASLAAASAASLLLAAVVGWIGYVRTSDALAEASKQLRENRKANQHNNETVDLALNVFGKLFDQLAPSTNLSTPPLGLQRHGRGGPGPDPGGFADKGPPPDGGPPGYGGQGFGGPGGPGGRGGRGFDGPGGRGGRGGPDFGDPGGPMGPDGPWEKDGGPRGDVAETDLPLLLTVLDFYDQFARKNEDATNHRLRNEVALANRKIAAIYLRLDQPDKAEERIALAIATFKDLARENPSDAEVRFRLVQTYAIADPWTTPEADLPRAHDRLEHAQVEVDRLVEASPESFEYLHARLKVLYRLGVASDRLGRRDRAVMAYRQGIELATELIRGWPGDFRPGFDRAAIREALAMLLIDQGRKDDARRILGEIVEDVRTMPTKLGHGGPILDRVRAVAQMYQTLGDADRAEEMTRWVGELTNPAPSGGPTRVGDRAGSSGPPAESP